MAEACGCHSQELVLISEPGGTGSKPLRAAALGGGGGGGREGSGGRAEDAWEGAAEVKC